MGQLQQTGRVNMGNATVERVNVMSRAVAIAGWLLKAMFVMDTVDPRPLKKLFFGLEPT